MSIDSNSPVPLRLLHLEDSLADFELISEVLAKHWPDCQVERVQTRDRFVAALQREPFNLILSDFSLPGFNGLAALDLAREMRPETPYIFLSGTIGEENAVEALKKGATDYVIKDRMARLVPAVRRALDDAASRRRRRRIEQKLEENEERFQQLAEQSSEIFWIVGLNPERILFIGPAIERIWGLPADAFYADPRAWVSAIHPEDRGRVGRAYEDCATGRAFLYEEEYRVVRPDGSVRWVLDSGTLIRDQAGVAVRLSGIAKDITERKMNEERLREQAGLLDKARDAIVVCGVNRRILFWNQGAERIFGWTAAEAASGISADLFATEALGRIASDAEAMPGDEWHGEVQVHHKTGKILSLDSSVTLIRDAEGRPKSYLMISTDLTERKDLEKQLLRAQRLESIGMLAGGIAHDLNNVLAPILMSVNLLQQTVGDSGTQRLLRVLETSATHGAGLIRQVLAFARGVEGERDNLQPHLVIRDVVQLLTETLPRAITVESDVPGDLALVHSNSTHLSQVLMNLSVNARDAMPGGGQLKIRARNVTVDEALARTQPGAKPGPHVLIAVADTGTGIPPGILDRIFDPFFTTKAVGKGTGLGLSTVIGIVKSEGGFVTVDSKVGRGTEFRLYFPAVLTTAKAPEKSVGDEPDRGRGETILVIDDEESICLLADALLVASGYRVITAGDGTAGLAAFRAHRAEIKAVLTDVMMPGMQGAQIVRELRAIDPQVRVVAMSGIVSDSSELKEEPGRLKFLPKPMTGPQLVQAVQSVLPRE